ncbi:MAG: DUF1667 domain-containing protein [Ignisphaera sp.]|nr:DUF1667 domain-containing protein [Ignisphaera sp.]MCX8168380.1 DUF1667 domain-containing protein [Ignisphaera sp.]MDW8085788.1 DUF1667 domain-containing protein [Ignisphaera sp.]
MNSSEIISGAKEELICIICPIGCSLEVYRDSDDIHVKGALCPKGIEYAKQEFLDPRRVVMTVVRVKNGDLPVVSVKTSVPVLKKCINDIMMITASIEVVAPVEIGQVIARDICGANIVATREVKKINNCD